MLIDIPYNGKKYLTDYYIWWHQVSNYSRRKDNYKPVDNLGFHAYDWKGIPMTEEAFYNKMWELYGNNIISLWINT